MPRRIDYYDDPAAPEPNSLVPTARRPLRTAREQRTGLSHRGLAHAT
jgi:hypothetical protein